MAVKNARRPSVADFAGGQGRVRERGEVGSGHGPYEVFPGGEVPVEGADADTGRGGHGPHVHGHAGPAERLARRGQDAFLVGGGVPPLLAVLWHPSTIAIRNTCSGCCYLQTEQVFRYEEAQP